MTEKQRNRTIAETKRCLRGLHKMLGKGYFHPSCLQAVEENILILKEDTVDVKEFEEKLKEWKSSYDRMGTVREIPSLYAIYQSEYPDDEFYYIQEILDEKNLQKMLALFTRKVELPSLTGSEKQISWAEDPRIVTVAEFIKAICHPDVPDNKRYDMEYIEEMQWSMQAQAIYFLQSWTKAKDYIDRRGWYGPRIQSLLQYGS